MLTCVIDILRQHQEDPGLFEKVVRGTFAYGSPQMQLMADARLIATEAHRFDTRYSGEAYVRHAELVTVIDMEYLGCTDPVELASDLTHDVGEDHGEQWPIYRIGERLGKEVAETDDWVNRRRFDYVRDVSEAKRLFFHNLLFVAPLRPIRVKLCDQLHNGLTPWNLDDEAWVGRKVHDLREYYIPMAKKVGVLYRELIEVTRALENGICLLPPVSIPQNVSSTHSAGLG
ncbi:MAG: hypothetical protein PHH40_01060 [Candidatus Moranbacteria bacterium]|nr:hypothetical protein [Candidatus Moranbacteria bacterium]MDD3964902.1 hypothetical protein [Candidatus Moranbacteria bacterium]